MAGLPHDMLINLSFYINPTIPTPQAGYIPRLNALLLLQVFSQLTLLGAQLRSQRLSWPPSPNGIPTICKDKDNNNNDENSNKNIKQKNTI
jgi:hypothetical protein